MNRKLFIRFGIFILVLVVLQIPLLQNWVFFGVAFPFQYIGLIILLPYNLNRPTVMIVAFFLGLLIDAFSNTPGMHALATVFIAFIRHYWIEITTDTADEDLDLSISHLGYLPFLFLIFPLVLVHHIILFLLENEGFGNVWTLLNKAFWSSIASSIIVLLAALIVSTKRRRI